MRDHLMSAQHTDKFVSIYHDYDDAEKFDFGRVCCVGNKEVLIQAVSPHGLYDGFFVVRLDDIERAECEGKYASRIRKLMTNGNCAKKVPFPTAPNLFEAMLKYAYAEKRVVTVGVENDRDKGIVGIVTELEQDICVIQQIDYYGDTDGTLTVRLNLIDYLTVDSIEDREYEILMN